MMVLLQVGPGAGAGGSSSVSRVTSRQSSTCSTIAQGGPRLLGVHGRGGSGGQRSASSVTSTPCLSRDNSRNSASGGSGGGGGAQQNSMHVQTSFDGGQFGLHGGKREVVMNEVYKKVGGVTGSAASQPTPLVTVITADSEQVGAKQVTSGAGAFLGAGAGAGVRGPGLCMTISGAPSPRQLSRQGSSIESSTVHTHTGQMLYLIIYSRKINLFMKGFFSLTINLYNAIDRREQNFLGHVTCTETITNNQLRLKTLCHVSIQSEYSVKYHY